MWQISWMLGWLPDWFWQATLGLGIAMIIAARFMRFIPFVSSYRIPLNIGGIAVTIASVWFLGGAANEEKWQRRVKELEEKIKVAEAQSKEANVQIQEKVVYKDKVIKEKGQEVVKYVDKFVDREVLKTIEGPERVRVEEVIKYVENCPVPTDLVQVHNRAIEELGKARKDKAKPTEEKK